VAGFGPVSQRSCPTGSATREPERAYRVDPLHSIGPRFLCTLSGRARPGVAAARASHVGRGHTNRETPNCTTMP
jgi:hypothetical protein